MFIRCLQAILITFLSALMLSTAVIRAEESIRITSGEWPPFLSEKLEHYGVGSRIVTEALKAAGYSVQYGFFPWSKSLDLARVGIWQASIAWTFNEERAKFFYYSDPIFEADEVFFHLKSRQIEWSEWKDLKSYKIGATGGYFYGEDFKNAYENNSIDVLWASSDTRNLKKLILGEVDLVINNEYVGWFLLQTEFPSEVINKITHHPKKIRSGSWHLLMSKAIPTNEKIIQDFNQGLKILKEKVRIQKWLKAAKGYTKREIKVP